MAVASGRLVGKRALIYGGGTGLGYACAEAMVAEGASVFISSRREKVLEESCVKLRAIGPAGFSAGDATSAADVLRVTAKAVEAMGGLDTLVISAGAGGRTSVFDTDPDHFQNMMDQNMRPVFLSSRYAVRHLVAAGAGSIIAISSMYGLVGQRERIGYCAAKAGVIGFVKAAALDLADKGVRANAICPGFIETDLAIEVANLEADPEAALRHKRLMHAIPRPGKPEEVGAAAVYLASDASAFMTGQALTIDGGYTVR